MIRSHSEFLSKGKIAKLLPEFEPNLSKFKQTRAVGVLAVDVGDKDL
jgi:hypothetical protein